MQKVAVFGGSGMVGSNFIYENSHFFDIAAPDEHEVDILDEGSLESFLKSSSASCVVNFAAFTNVSAAETERGDENGIVFRLNASAVRDIAEVCKKLGIHLVHISTEYVFDGNKVSGPYTEDDEPCPINWYGETKFCAERFLVGSNCDYTIMRIAMPYCAEYTLKKDIARKFLEMLEEGQEINAISDSQITPVLVTDISKALRAVITRRALGLYHVVSVDPISPFDFVQLLARTFNLDSAVKPISFDDYRRKTNSPLLKNSSLDAHKFVKEFGGGILHTNLESIKLFKRQHQKVTHA